MNHVYAMFQCDSDDVILGQVGSHRSKALANLVRLISLVLRASGTCDDSRRDSPDLLSMGRHAVLEGVDGDGVHRELVRSAENANSNLLYILPSVVERVLQSP